MRCSPSKNTEERIREAARQVFLEKGFDGTQGTLPKLPVSISR